MMKRFSMIIEAARQALADFTEGSEIKRYNEKHGAAGFYLKDSCNIGILTLKTAFCRKKV